jgi:phage shock protein A
MGIFSRLKTMISSNVNDLISKAEKPEKMLNQLIIDMQTQLLESKKAVALAIADEKKLERQTRRHRLRNGKERPCWL